MMARFWSEVTTSRRERFGYGPGKIVTGISVEPADTGISFATSRTQTVEDERSLVAVRRFTYD